MPLTLEEMEMMSVERDVDRLDYGNREYRYSGQHDSPPGRKPPAHVRLPLPGQGCSVEMFARQTGWSATYVRKWFVANPEDCSIAGHGEEMHRGPYRSFVSRLWRGNTGPSHEEKAKAHRAVLTRGIQGYR